MESPTDIKARSSDHTLRVAWQSEHDSAYGFKYLRCQCGCASCVDERTGVRTLNPDDVAEDISIEEMSLVGNYAVQFRWSDGHTTGIYSWDYLLRLCPCDQCGGPKPFDHRLSPLGTK
ncbi:MAG: DUF971 domain-containing protein [Planctomycetes bacterium]|nr:DUF971 domain-containing protein [Planctomycetota bacterium]